MGFFSRLFEPAEKKTFRAKRNRVLGAMRRFDFAAVDRELALDPSLVYSKDLDGDKNSLLHVACSLNSVELVDCLLARDADIRATGNLG